LVLLKCLIEISQLVITSPHQNSIIKEGGWAMMGLAVILLRARAMHLRDDAHRCTVGAAVLEADGECQHRRRAFPPDAPTWPVAVQGLSVVAGEHGIAATYVEVPQAGISTMDINGPGPSIKTFDQTIELQIKNNQILPYVRSKKQIRI